MVGGKMRGAPRPGGGVIHLSRIRAGERDELAQILRRERARHDQQLRRAGDVEHRHDVAQRIEGQRAVQERRDDDVSAGNEQQRVAVGRRFRDVFDREVARGARFVLDHHLLAEPPREAFGGHAREVIGNSAGRGPRHQADGPRRIGLGLRGRGPGKKRGGKKRGHPEGADRIRFHGAAKGSISLQR